MKKTCKQCEKELFLESFHKDVNNKDGHVSKCKSCVKKYTDKYNDLVPRFVCSVCTKTKWGKSFNGSTTICLSCERKQVRLNPKTIVCRKCDVEQNLDNFIKNVNYLNGFNSKCKKCCNNERNNDIFRAKNNIRVKTYYKRRFFYARAAIIRNRSKKEDVECNLGVQDLAIFLSKQWKKQKGICLLTGDRLTRENAVVDHITAISKSGDSNTGNLRWITKESNKIKGSLSDERLNEIALKLSKTMNINYVNSFIHQFSEELSDEDWSVSRFLDYLKLNNYYLYNIKKK